MTIDHLTEGATGVRGVMISGNRAVLVLGWHWRRWQWSIGQIHARTYRVWLGPACAVIAW